MGPAKDGNEISRRKYDLVLEQVDYPQWTGQPERTLLVCTLQRSGSTLLGEAIYFARGLGCPLEYFHQGFRPGFERRWGTRDIRTYAAAVHRNRTDPSGICSVKLFWRDVVEIARELAPRDFAWLSRATSTSIEATIYRRIYATIAELFPNASWVSLTRRDQIAQAVSLSIAGQTERWRQFGRPRKFSPPYSFDNIVQRLAEIQHETEHWLNFFRANELNCYAIAYEDLADQYEATVRRLLTWLGRTDASIPPPRLRKQADAESETLRQRFLIEFRHRTGGD